MGPIPQRMTVRSLSLMKTTDARFQQNEHVFVYASDLSFVSSSVTSLRPRGCDIRLRSSKFNNSELKSNFSNVTKMYWKHMWWHANTYGRYRRRQTVHIFLLFQMLITQLANKWKLQLILAVEFPNKLFFMLYFPQTFCANCANDLFLYEETRDWISMTVKDIYF